MKFSRLRKLTWKVLFIYTFCLLLVFFSEPNPRAIWFWLGLCLLLVGTWLRIWAAGHLVKNKILTTSGPYAHVKNPLYVGTFLLLVGFTLFAQGKAEFSSWVLRHLNWLILAFGTAAFLAYYVPRKRRREGQRMLRLFGSDWERYDRSVPDYFPRRTPYEGASPIRWSGKRVCKNSELWTAFACAILMAAMLFNRILLGFAQKVLP